MDKMDRQSIEEMNTNENGYWDDSDEDQALGSICETEPCDLPRCEHERKHFNLAHGTYECMDCPRVFIRFDLAVSPRELREKARLA